MVATAPYRSRQVVNGSNLQAVRTGRDQLRSAVARRHNGADTEADQPHRTASSAKAWSAGAALRAYLSPAIARPTSRSKPASSPRGSDREVRPRRRRIKIARRAAPASTLSATDSSSGWRLQFPATLLSSARRGPLITALRAIRSYARARLACRGPSPPCRSLPASQLASRMNKARRTRSSALIPAAHHRVKSRRWRARICSCRSP